LSHGTFADDSGPLPKAVLGLNAARLMRQVFVGRPRQKWRWREGFEGSKAVQQLT
jgi:hypothetical protein